MANPNDTSLEQARKTLVQQILELREKERQSLEKGQKITKEAINELSTKVKLLNKIVGLVNEENNALKELKGNYASAEEGINSMTSMQEKLKHELKESVKVNLDWADSIGSASKRHKEGFQQASTAAAGTIQSIAELAGLNKEDTAAIAEKSQEIDNQLNALASQIAIAEGLYKSRARTSAVDRTMIGTLWQQYDSLKGLKEEAGKFANISKETKELHEELNEDLESINKTFKKVTTAAEVFFSSTRNMIGMALFGAGELAHKFHEVGREMGYSLTQATGFKSQILLAGILSEESAEAVKELGKELGDTSHISNGMAADAAMLAYHYKLSGEQAAYLSTAFGELQGQSWDTGQNTLKYVSALSAANGVMPGEAMKDIANNSEFMAKFTQEGGKNIAEAAVAAAKLGIGLGTAEKMADHLLDYQTSVSDEMEASVLLGRDLNLGKARELAYNGKIAESMEAGLEAIGGISEYNKMDYYQRQAVAKALGVSNAEMQKMVAHEETLKGMHGVAAQQYERISTLMHVIGDSMAGKVLKGMGGLVLSGVQLSSQMAMIGDKMPGLQKAFGYLAKPFDFLIGKVADFIGLIGKAIAKMVGLKAAESGLDAGTSIAGKATKDAQGKFRDAKGRYAKTPAAATPPPAAAGGDTAGQANKFSKIKSGDLIKGAVALLILAAALFVAAKAFQQFGSVTWESVAMGLVALTGLAAIAYVLGKAQGEMIKGAIAVALLGVALIPFAFAMNLIGGLDIGSVLAAAAGLVIFAGAAFILGTLMMGPGAIIFGAGLLALVGLGLAMMVLGAGLNLVAGPMASFTASFAALDVGKLALFGLALIPLGLGLALFGTFAGPIMMGALALLVFGTALGILVAGAAGMGATLGGIQTYVTGLIAIVPQILSLALAFSALALSLAMIGQMGIAALPVLAGLAIGGGILMALMGGGSGAGAGKEDTSTKLLEEIMGLRKDMSDGKIAVYIDGKKMNTGLSISNKRQPT
jgi:hypothetical protein